jgi:hypothetical protein
MVIESNIPLHNLFKSYSGNRTYLQKMRRIFYASFINDPLALAIYAFVGWIAGDRDHLHAILDGSIRLIASVG